MKYLFYNIIIIVLKNFLEVLVCDVISVLNKNMKHVRAIKFDYVKILAML